MFFLDAGENESNSNTLVELHKANQNIEDLHEELKDVIQRRYHLSLQETTKVNAKQRKFLM
jgi:hypothetical protein